MDSDYRIAIDGGIIRVELTGLAHYDVTHEMLLKVAELATSTRLARLLFDLRQVDVRDSAVNTIRHTEEADQMGFAPGLRVAVLGLANDPMLQYIEDVSVNRGRPVRVFTDEQEAVKWLHASS